MTPTPIIARADIFGGRAAIHGREKMLLIPVILSAARGSGATKGKSKDPENASSAMLHQGVSREFSAAGGEQASPGRYRAGYPFINNVSAVGTHRRTVCQPGVNLSRFCERPIGALGKPDSGLPVTQPTLSPTFARSD